MSSKTGPQPPVGRVVLVKAGARVVAVERRVTVGVGPVAIVHVRHKKAGTGVGMEMTQEPTPAARVVTVMGRGEAEPAFQHPEAGKEPEVAM